MRGWRRLALAILREDGPLLAWQVAHRMGKRLGRWVTTHEAHRVLMVTARRCQVIIETAAGDVEARGWRA